MGVCWYDMYVLGLLCKLRGVRDRWTSDRSISDFIGSYDAVEI